GSALAANGLAALAFTNTNTAAAAALVTWALVDFLRSGKVTAVGAATGLVVGLVAITPASGYVTAQASVVIGIVAALISYTAIQIRSKTKLDDSLDVFSCHGENEYSGEQGPTPSPGVSLGQGVIVSAAPPEPLNVAAAG